MECVKCAKKCRRILLLQQRKSGVSPAKFAMMGGSTSSLIQKLHRIKVTVPHHHLQSRVPDPVHGPLLRMYKQANLPRSLESLPVFDEMGNS